MSDADGVRARIDAYNRGRRPQLVERKYAAMRADPFVFFRGAAHLFWSEWSTAAGTLNTAPLTWSCGDLHLENFGSYRGDNGLAYFDLNDFDEAALAPASADPARFLTSARLAGHALALDAAAVGDLSTTFLDNYAGALTDGKAHWIERATSTGMIRELLRSVKLRTRQRLLGSRTILSRGRRRLRTDGKRAFPLLAQERRGVKDCIHEFAESERDPGFFDVIDVAGRIAGTGSLGVRRYVVLVRGKGGPDGQRLLDIKEAQPSTLAANLGAAVVTQPRWRTEADRVVGVQQRMQAVSPALLRAVSLSHGHFILRELQPSEDRLALGNWNGKLSRLRKVMATMGHLTAWSQLRSASRDGAAGIDALIAFSRDKSARRDLMSYARECANRVERDWREFTAAPS